VSIRFRTRFFDQHLWKIAGRELDMAHTNEPAQKLAVFPDGPPADAQNYRIHETFTAGPQAARFTALSAWEARRKTLIETLQSKVFAAVPRKPRNVRVDGAGTELRLTSTTLCLSARHGGGRPRRARPCPPCCTSPRMATIPPPSTRC